MGLDERSGAARAAVCRHMPPMLKAYCQRSFSRGLLVLACLGAVAFVAGCRTPPQQAASTEQDRSLAVLEGREADMADALAYYGAGVLREGLRDSGAVSNYMRAAELAPENTSLAMRVAVQFIRRGENDRAVAIMEEACRRNPRSMEAAFILSQVYQIINRPAAARAAAARAIELDPHNSKGYLQLAAIWIGLKDEKSAVKVLQDGLAKVKDPLPMLRLLGDLHAQHIYEAGHKSENLPEAIKYYEKAAAQPTDDLSPAYLQKLGDLFIISGRTAKALACFQKAAIYDPDDLQLMQKIALCHLGLGEREKTVELLRKISGKDPQNPAINYYLGELYESLGDRQRAVECFDAARAAEPSNPKSYLKMAVIHLRDNPRKAEEVIRDGLKHLPKEKLFLELLSQIYLRNRQFNEALSVFARLRGVLSPGDPLLSEPGFYVNYGLAAQQCRQADLALELYRRALDLDPSLLETRIRLATLLIWKQEREEAFSLMDDVTLAAPDNFFAWYYYAVLSSRAGEYSQSIALFARAAAAALALGARGAQLLDSGFYFYYASAHERNGNITQAEKLFAEAIAADPENSDAFNYLAYMWAEKGVRLDLAADYVSHALEVDPDNPAYLDTLGWIRYRQGMLAEALDLVQDANALMPGDATILDHLGDIFMASGNEAAALDAWKRSFSRDPANRAVGKKLTDRGVDTEKLRREASPPEMPPPSAEE